MVPRSAFIAFLLAVAPMTTASELSPETFLPLHENRDAYGPCVAFGGNAYLVAWQSGRTAPGDLREGLRFIGDIVACRVDKTGKPMDAEPFVVSGAADLQERAVSVFGGGVFLVVWQDARNGKDWDVYAARVSAEGKVLDPDGILVAGGAHNQAKPCVVWDGKAFVIVWQDYRSGKWYEVRSARVSPEGKVLDPDGAKVASGDFYHCYAPAAASVGNGRTFVLWVALGLPVDNHRAPIASGRFLVDGVPEPALAYTFDRKDPASREHGPTGNGQPIAMAAGPRTFLAAWKNDSPQGRGNGPRSSNAALFDEKGARTLSFLLGSETGKGDKRILDPDVAWDGSAFVAAWYEFARETKDACPSDVVCVARISESGQVQGGVQKLSGTLASPASQPAVASDGAGTSLIAYEKHPATGDVPIRIALRVLSAR